MRSDAAANKQIDFSSKKNDICLAEKNVNATRYLRTSARRDCAKTGTRRRNNTSLRQRIPGGSSLKVLYHQLPPILNVFRTVVHRADVFPKAIQQTPADMQLYELPAL
jgi:hypothetical protein